MIKVEIKKGRIQDAAAILSVMEDVYEASPWKLEQIQADLEQESISYFLAVDEGQVLGFQVDLLHQKINDWHQGDTMILFNS